jgi:RimJ/RimL family protein N-acetyltransferase
MGFFDTQNKKCKNGETLTLRSAVLADANKINLLATEVFNTSNYLITLPDEFSSFTEEQQQERIKKYCDDNGNLLLVVEFNGDIVGMIDFQNGKRKRIAHKGSFGMSVSSYWRNKGVGYLLLSGLIDWVKGHPFIEVINLGVIEENKPAIALYSKLGFEKVGREPYGVKIDEERLVADLTMSLRVIKKT